MVARDRKSVRPNEPQTTDASEGLDRLKQHLTEEVAQLAEDRASMPISLRLGGLGDDVILRKQSPTESPAAVMRRDLERYYTTAFLTMCSLGLTKAEARFLLVALKQGWARERRRVELLWVYLEDYRQQLRARLIDAGKKTPMSKENRADLERAAQAGKGLVEKLRHLPPIVAQAVVDAGEICLAHPEWSWNTAAALTGISVEFDTAEDEE
jgi:hypothetical protein